MVRRGGSRKRWRGVDRIRGSRPRWRRQPGHREAAPPPCGPAPLAAERAGETPCAAVGRGSGPAPRLHPGTEARPRGAVGAAPSGSRGCCQGAGGAGPGCGRTRSLRRLERETRPYLCTLPVPGADSAIVCRPLAALPSLSSGSRATAGRRRPHWPGQALPRGPSQAAASQASGASPGER